MNGYLSDEGRDALIEYLLLAWPAAVENKALLTGLLRLVDDEVRAAVEEERAWQWMKLNRSSMS
jgi:hypothetical protein